MQIFNYFDSSGQNSWLAQIKACDWSAAAFLAELLEQRRFEDVLGKGGKLFIMADDDRLAGFATLTPRDCIEDDSLFPWIGFVFVCPEYRGKRCSGVIIDAACQDANRQGFDQVFLATDHIGLYEKYGFEYVETRTDVYNEQSRIYLKYIQMKENRS